MPRFKRRPIRSLKRASLQSMPAELLLKIATDVVTNSYHPGRDLVNMFNALARSIPRQRVNGGSRLPFKPLSNQFLKSRAMVKKRNLDRRTRSYVTGHLYDYKPLFLNR